MVEETRQQRIERILDQIQADMGVHGRITNTMVVKTFQQDSTALSAEEISAQLPLGGWFQNDSTRINDVRVSLQVLENYKLLFKYPDGKYVYRDFK